MDLRQLRWQVVAVPLAARPLASCARRLHGRQGACTAWCESDAQHRTARHRARRMRAATRCAHLSLLTEKRVRRASAPHPAQLPPAVSGLQPPSGHRRSCQLPYVLRFSSQFATASATSSTLVRTEAHVFLRVSVSTEGDLQSCSALDRDELPQSAKGSLGIHRDHLRLTRHRPATK
jgi:hypothetical protein